MLGRRCVLWRVLRLEFVETNILIRDMDHGICATHGDHDALRLEVMADGLPLSHGAQLPIETTSVSIVRRDGLPRPRSVREGSRKKRQFILTSRGTSVGSRLVVGKKRLVVVPL